jgi:hypothetical protein
VTGDEEARALSDDEESPQEIPSADPEVPEADALDQAREVTPGERRGPVSRAIDAPEADALEQAIEVPDDEPMPPDAEADDLSG